MVYFVGNREHNLVKIGTSKNVKKRIECIQIGFPYTLETFITLEGGEQVEKTLHFKFKEYHLRGEWFKLSKEILDFIETPEIIKHSAFKDAEDNRIRYSEEICDKIEEMYHINQSNEKIAELIGVSIYKVRRVIRTRKLAAKYKRYTGKYGYEYNKVRRIRAKARLMYKKGLITITERDKIITDNPLVKMKKREDLTLPS